MKKHYIGIMSGTSLDAIDAALVTIQAGKTRLIDHLVVEFPATLRRQLLDICSPGDNEIERMGRLDAELGELYAETALQLCRQSDTPPAQIEAIGCHGQTIRHHPDGPYGFTLQIGDANRIAERTGISTITDFRRRDIAAGGQGAPLVPAFHADQFQTTDEYRVVVNIGGMSNITILPNSKEPVYGFDTGPGNVLMDTWIKQQQGVDFDTDGQWASQGKIDERFLERCLNEGYFQKQPPKSTGRELFDQQWLTAQLQGFNTSPVDVQATLAELTALCISDAVTRYAADSKKLLVCGGGARNTHLLQRLAALLPNNSVETTTQHGLGADWVEAAAFAWLAYRTLAGLPGNLPAVTGADHPVILGAIYPASQ